MFDKIWTQNPHGGGVGFWRGTEPVIMCSLNNLCTWDNYEKACAEIMKKKGSKFLILHCRVSTHGSKTLSNTHPFFVPVGTGIIMAHNGQTNHDGITRPYEWSDTRTLAQCWIPKFAPDIMTKKFNSDNLQKQLNGSRLALIEPEFWRLYNFPEQKPEVEGYGTFSNMIWHEKYKPVKVTGCTWSMFKDNEQNHKEDFERWSKVNPHKTPFLSSNMTARSFFYSVLHNLSFGAAMMMYKNIFHDFPTNKQMEDFASHYEDTLTSVSNYHEEQIPQHWKDIWETPFLETEDELMMQWLEESGIAMEEKEEKKPEIQSSGEKDPVIQPWEVEEDFPFGDHRNENLHNEAVKTYGNP